MRAVRYTLTTHLATFSRDARPYLILNVIQHGLARPQPQLVTRSTVLNSNKGYSLVLLFLYSAMKTKCPGNIHGRPR